MSTHANDFFGEEIFEANIIRNLKQKLKNSQEDIVNFKYLGLELCKKESEILISQNSYIESVQNINLSSKQN